MNITEFMSFDLAWFTTLPGILITGGVVVLLIALILFIASNRKNKNKSPEVSPVDNGGMQPVVNSDFNNSMPASDMTAVPGMPLDSNIVMNNDLNGFNMMNNINPVDNNVVPSVDEPVVPSYDIPAVPTNVVDFSAPVQPMTNEIPNNMVADNMNVVPTVDVSTPVVDIPVVPTVTPEVTTPVVNEAVAPVINEPLETVAPVMVEPVVPEVAPVVPEVIPAVAEVTPSVTPVMETPVEQEKPVIYGGVDPANTVTAAVPEKPVIYGGANPLENTTTIPRMVNNEAYGANVVTPVEPVAPAIVEPEVPNVAPVVPEVATAVVEPTPSVTPVVETPFVSTAMPMTGAEMFGSTDTNVDSSPVSTDNEIETLEF